MWALLGGFFIGRGFRNAGLPDSVKQQRYDARLAKKRRRTDAPTRPWSEQWGVAWFRWAVIAVGVVTVFAIVVSVTK